MTAWSIKSGMPDSITLVQILYFQWQLPWTKISFTFFNNRVVDSRPGKGVLKLEPASESPAGHVKAQSTGIYTQSLLFSKSGVCPDLFGVLKSYQVLLMLVVLLVWRPRTIALKEKKKTIKEILPEWMAFSGVCILLSRCSVSARSSGRFPEFQSYLILTSFWVQFALVPE